MNLPKQLDTLRKRKIWLCYPLIENKESHSGYDKPPINPNTLKNGSATNSDSWATFDEANAQIGKAARIFHKGKYIECTVAGVGLALANSGVCGIDYDNVIRYKDDGTGAVIKKEAVEIVNTINTYTEISVSGTGLHSLYFGKVPEGNKLYKKYDENGNKLYEIEFYTAGKYLTLSGRTLGDTSIAERTAEAQQIHDKYFIDRTKPTAPAESQTVKKPSPVVLCESENDNVFTLRKWQEYIQTATDDEILTGIFRSGASGRKAQALYDGDMSAYGNDHSRADQALISLLYSFTQDDDKTLVLFMSSALYRETGKAKNYLQKTLERAKIGSAPLIGHIELSFDEKKAYAQRKEAEEREKLKQYAGDFTKYKEERRKLKKKNESDTFSTGNVNSFNNWKNGRVKY